jgi:hypothetical protein
VGTLRQPLFESGKDAICLARNKRPLPSQAKVSLAAAEQATGTYPERELILITPGAGLQALFFALPSGGDKYSSSQPLRLLMSVRAPCRRVSTVVMAGITNLHFCLCAVFCMM